MKIHYNLANIYKKGRIKQFELDQAFLQPRIF